MKVIKDISTNFEVAIQDNYGWYWFNTRDEAKAALGVSDPVLPEGPEFPTLPTP